MYQVMSALKQGKERWGQWKGGVWWGRPIWYHDWFRDLTEVREQALRTCGGRTCHKQSTITVSQSIRATFTKWHTLDWEAYKQQILISLRTGGWKAEIRVPSWSGEALLKGGTLLVSLHGEVASELCGASFIRVRIPLRRASFALMTYHCQTPPPTNAITLSIRFPSWICEGQTFRL